MKKLFRYLSELLGNEEIAEQAERKFSEYRDFLIEQNKFFNLTAITAPEEIEIKHFIDSVSAYPYISGAVADIGSGAGFPAVPLKIIKPELEFTLIDSLNKRVNFLNALIEKLGLENIRAIHSRAEDLPKTTKYDTIVARAVSELNTLAEYCIPFVKVGGRFIAYKSNDCEEEIKRAKKAISVLGGEIEQTEEITLFETDIKRKLIIIRKIKETPLNYPRGQNKPKKQPL